MAQSKNINKNPKAIVTSTPVLPVVVLLTGLLLVVLA
jgi:hypothetical protein